MMYRDRETCRAVYSAVPAGVPVFGLAGTLHQEVAKELNLPFVAELYGDVKYSKDGTLVIDRKKKAWTPEETKKHISSQVENSTVTAVTGEEVELPVGVRLVISLVFRYTDVEQDHTVSLCCHSDSPGQYRLVKTFGVRPSLISSPFGVIGAVQIVTAARQIVDEFNKKMGYA